MRKDIAKGKKGPDTFHGSLRGRPALPEPGLPRHPAKLLSLADVILGSPHLTHGLVDAALLEGTEKKKGHSRRDRLCGSKLLQEATYAYHRCKMPKHVEMTEDLKRGQSPFLKKGL